MSEFICPHCKEELKFVNIISACIQEAELNGNKITDYGSVETVGNTIRIECPQCNRDITNNIEEL